jgi:hypothetical protein
MSASVPVYPRRRVLEWRCARASAEEPRLHAEEQDDEESAHWTGIVDISESMNAFYDEWV